MNKGIITFSNDDSGSSNNARNKNSIVKNNDQQTNLINNVKHNPTTESNSGTISIINSKNSTPTSPTLSVSIPTAKDASSSPTDLPSSSPSSSNWKQTTTPSSKGKARVNDNESSNNRTQAAFVNKLYKMLEDESIQHLISWSEGGDLFSVSNPTAFSKLVLPQYFKHNNWQSFVRQLNMYGFHKVNDMIHSNLTSECQKWEFRHQNFRRGAVDELQNIKRKSAKSHHQYLSSSTAASPASTSSMGRLLLGHPNQHQQQQPYQHTSNNNHLDNKLVNDPSTEKLQSNPLCQQVVRLEDRMNKISQSQESLKSETSELKSILSRQQIAMQNIADVLLRLASEGNNGSHSDTIESIKKYVNSISNPTPLGERTEDDAALEYSIRKRLTLDNLPSLTITTSQPSTPPTQPAPPAPPPTAHSLPPPSFSPNVDINKSNSLTSSPIQYHNNVTTTSSNSSNSSKTSRKSDGMPISSILSPSLPLAQKQDEPQHSAPSTEQQLSKRLPSIDAVYMGPYSPHTSSSSLPNPSSIVDYDRSGPALKPLLPLRSLLHLTDSRAPGLSDTPKDAMTHDETRSISPLMGLGKESSLLNPQPTTRPPHLPFDYNSIHETKRRRTDQ